MSLITDVRKTGHRAWVYYLDGADSYYGVSEGTTLFSGLTDSQYLVEHSPIYDATVDTE